MFKKVKETIRKLKDSVKKSWTMALAAVGTIGTGAAYGVGVGLDAFPVLFSPDLVSNVKAFVPQAKMALYTAGMSFMFGLARLRSLWKQL